MTNIICNSTIEYTKDDDFNITVESDSELTETDTLRLIIAKDENSSPVVDNTFSVNADLVFVLFLSDEDKKNLQMGDYIYKLVLTSLERGVITQKSGNFIVKWGA